MKNILKVFTIILVSSSLILTSCNANNTQKGAGIGAAVGGILGGVLGNNLGSKDNAALGAVLGAAVGGTAGGLIGNKMDKQAREIQTNIPGAKVERVGEGIKVVLNENAIRFEFDKADLTAAAKTNLDKIATTFSTYNETNIVVYGYTDSKGSESYNLKLSERRAQSVVDYLVSKGISASRLTMKGMGIADPIGDNSTDAGRALNRRVEFAITANENMVKEAQQQASGK